MDLRRDVLVPCVNERQCCVCVCVYACVCTCVSLSAHEQLNRNLSSEFHPTLLIIGN